MSEYKRLDGGNGAGEAKLEKVKSYRLEPGHAGVYDVGAIHAIDYPEGSRFVRVTGRDLDHVQRLKVRHRRRQGDHHRDAANRRGRAAIGFPIFVAQERAQPDRQRRNSFQRSRQNSIDASCANSSAATAKFRFWPARNRRS